MQKALPCNTGAEQYVLGCVLLDGALFAQATGILGADDFMLEKHRRIFRAHG